MTANFQPIISDPGLPEVLAALKKDILLSLNCHHIATVQSVNFTDQTLVASINYSKTYYQQDDTGAFVASNVPYPLLLDVPFIVIGGGTVSFTMPIASGDECLILFNDRDIDNWFSGQTPGGAVSSGRLHALADGIALVGLNTASSYDTVRALLTNGTVMLGINPTNNKVLITNGTNLYTLLSNLISAIEGLTVLPSAMVAPSGGGPVTGVGMLSDVGGAVAAAKAALGNLFE